MKMYLINTTYYPRDKLNAGAQSIKWQTELGIKINRKGIIQHTVTNQIQKKSYINVMTSAKVEKNGKEFEIKRSKDRNNFI